MCQCCTSSDRMFAGAPSMDLVLERQSKPIHLKDADVWGGECFGD